MPKNLAILIAILIPALVGDPVVDAATPRKESFLPPVYSYRAADVTSLRRGFTAPPREAGPWLYWMFFENVMAKEEITRELEEMAVAGIAGAELRFVSMHGFFEKPGPWFDPEGWARLGQKRLEFLSPEFVEMLEHTCAEAQRLGMRLAINTGMGWPPGGPWIIDQHRSKHLAWESHQFTGPAVFEEKDLPPNSMVLAWRIDTAGDEHAVVPGSFQPLTGRIQWQGNNGSLRWDVPEGQWLLGTFRVTLGGLCDKGNGPEADPGSREAVLFHLNHVFSRLDPKLHKYYGTTLTAGHYRTDQERVAITLSLGPHESTIVVFVRAAARLHAVRCDGGRVVYEPDGKLYARLDGSGPCRVELSDGQTRELRATLPPPISLDGPWTIAAVPGSGVGLAAPVKVQLDKLVSWREIPGLRTYAGIARYETSFDVPPEFLRGDVGALLELGEVYELAAIAVRLFDGGTLCCLEFSPCLASILSTSP